MTDTTLPPEIRTIVESLEASGASVRVVHNEEMQVANLVDTAVRRADSIIKGSSLSEERKCEIYHAVLFVAGFNKSGLATLDPAFHLAEDHKVLVAAEWVDAHARMLVSAYRVIKEAATEIGKELFPMPPIEGLQELADNAKKTLEAIRSLRQ